METWRRVWGNGTNFHEPRFLNDGSLREKIPFSRPKLPMTFFSHRPGFLIFRIFTVLNVLYDPFFTRKTTISEKNSLMTPFSYSVRTFPRIRQHYFSKYWGDGCMGRPHLNFWGGLFPQSPLVSALAYYFRNQQCFV